MALPEELRQRRFTERGMNPTPNRFVVGSTGGVPKMHPLKSSNPVMKAGSLLHGLRIKKFKMPSIKKY